MTYKTKQFSESTIVKPKVWRHLIYFNFTNPSGRGDYGTACWDTRKGDWKPVRGEVGHAQKDKLQKMYSLK